MMKSYSLYLIIFLANVGLVSNASSSTTVGSKQQITERFLRSQADLKRHRAQLMSEFTLPMRVREKKVFKVQDGSRIFLRWSRRPSQRVSSIVVNLVSVRGESVSQELRIPRSEQWALKWYSVWLPYESEDVSILSVTARVDETNNLNPFSKHRRSTVYNSKLPIGRLSSKHPKKILMALENKTPMSQRSTSRPKLILRSVPMTEAKVR